MTVKENKDHFRPRAAKSESQHKFLSRSAHSGIRARKQERGNEYAYLR